MQKHPDENDPNVTVKCSNHTIINNYQQIDKIPNKQVSAQTKVTLNFLITVLSNNIRAFSAKYIRLWTQRILDKLDRCLLEAAKSHRLIE